MHLFFQVRKTIMKSVDRFLSCFLVVVVRRLERRHLRRLYYHLLWATCVLKRQCGGAEKLECLQNAKDRNSESRNSEKTFETWNISKPFSEMVKDFGVTYFRCDMVSIRRCHVLCDSIRPLALLISSHVSCNGLHFVRKSNKKKERKARLCE